MLEIIILSFVIWVFSKKAKTKRLSGILWGIIGTLSYYVPLVLVSFYVVPHVVTDHSGIGPVSRSTLFSLAGGIIGSAIAWFFLRAQPDGKTSQIDVLDAPEMIDPN